MRSQFALDADLQGVARGGGSLSQGLAEVERSRASRATTTAPAVSWSGEGVGDQVTSAHSYSRMKLKPSI